MKNESCCTLKMGMLAAFLLISSLGLQAQSFFPPSEAISVLSAKMTEESPLLGSYGDESKNLMHQARVHAYGVVKGQLAHGANVEDAIRAAVLEFSQFTITTAQYNADAIEPKALLLKQELTNLLKG